MKRGHFVLQQSSMNIVVTRITKKREGNRAAYALARYMVTIGGLRTQILLVVLLRKVIFLGRIIGLFISYNCEFLNSFYINLYMSSTSSCGVMSGEGFWIEYCSKVFGLG